MRIKRVTVDDLKVEVTYDHSQADRGQDRRNRRTLGADCPSSLRRAFVHYEEECEIGNLEVGERRTHD